MIDALSDHAGVLSAALLLDGLIGDPKILWRNVPHPVVLAGRAISTLERRFNKKSMSDRKRKNAGVAVLAALLSVALFAGMTLAFVLGWLAVLPFGWLPEALIVAILLAQKSLYQHVANVQAGFQRGGTPQAKKALKQIVSRDVARLEQADICRGAIESLAENFSDGVIAPAFWYLLAGLPGLLAYKILNTADSMIGYKNPRYEQFGWAAARLDDFANYLPARLSAGLIALASKAFGTSTTDIIRAVQRDAAKHRSPNAGWPETSMAAALGLALGGPRSYGAGQKNFAWLNEKGRHALKPSDIRDALRLYLAALFLHFAIIFTASWPLALLAAIS